MGKSFLLCLLTLVAYEVDVQDPYFNQANFSQRAVQAQPPLALLPFFKKNIFRGAAEMSQQLRAHSTLAEDPGLVPRTHMVAHGHLSVPVPGDPAPSLACVDTVCMWCDYIHKGSTACVRCTYIHEAKHSYT